MTPAVAEIVSRAVNSSPCATRTPVCQAHYGSYKIARLQSCYRKILREVDEIKKQAFKLSNQRTDVNANEEPFVNDMQKAASVMNDYLLGHKVLMQRAREVKPRLSRLDNKELIGRTHIDEWFKKVQDKESLEAWCQHQFETNTPDKENPVYRKAAQRGRNARADSLIFRIQEQIAEGGYPVFWTLTVEPRYEYILGKGREEFKLWTRKVRRKFGDFKYCAVTERGPDTGHIHLHALFIFESAAGFSDPNFGKPGSNLLIPELRTLWPYGFSDPVGVRFNPVDHFGALGWRWPIGQPTGNPMAVAAYMADYTTKDTGELEGWRTKMSRNFGTMKLNQMTQADALLILLGDDRKLQKKLNFVSEPPKKLLREIAAKKIFAKAFHHNLPETKIGSVSQAAKTLTTEGFNRQNVGDSVNLGAASDVELDQYRVLTKPHPIGGI
jgi:hypothetical protein